MFLALEIKTKNGWRFAELDADTEISIEQVSKLWEPDNGGSFSLPFTLNIDNNLPIFGNSGDMRGGSVYCIQDCACRIHAGGIILLSGIVKMDENVTIEVDEDTGERTVEIKIESNRKDLFEKMEDVGLRDLNIKQHKIQLGYALPENLEFHASYSHKVADAEGMTVKSEDVLCEKTISMPHIMIPNYHDNVYNRKFDGNFINAQNPYNPNDPLAFPFCNVRSCYMKYESKKANEWEEARGYSVGDIDRVNSAPCFYVPFVQDMLFQQMGIIVDKNSLNELLDFRRLAFWHADAQYYTEPVADTEVDVWANGGDGYVKFAHQNEENGVTVKLSYRSGRQYRCYTSYKDEKTDWVHSFKTTESIAPIYRLCRAYASEENFPDIDAKDLVEGMQNAFGARYFYDSQTNTLDILLVRDILSQPEAHELGGDIIGEPYKEESDTRGVRIKYAASSKADRNPLTGEECLVSGNDETAYNYNDYRSPYIMGDDYEETEEDRVGDYNSLLTHITDHEMRVFHDKVTSDEFRVKVNGDATTEGEWFPALFEVAGNHDVEIGDCSDDDYVHEIEIGFTPAVVNDVNFAKQYERAANSGLSDEQIEEGVSMSGENIKPKYAMYVEGEIHHKDDDSLIKRIYTYNSIALAYTYDYHDHFNYLSCHVDVDLEVKSVEDYSVDNGSDGPYYSNEADFTLGIMRGSGAGAGVSYYDGDCDGFGTERYVETAGSDAEFTGDTMDTYGNMFDYNGGGKMEGVTKAQAEMYFNSYFSMSNNKMSAAHTQLLDDYIMMAGKWYLFDRNRAGAPEDGRDSKIMTDSETQTYLRWLRNKLTNDGIDIMTADTLEYGTYKRGVRILIGCYDTEKDCIQMQKLYQQLMRIYIYNVPGEVDFPDNGLGYDVKDLISLKLQAEKLNPWWEPDNPAEFVVNKFGTKVPNTKYFPVTNELAKGRGIADKFYGAYIHWLLNGKVAHLPMMMDVMQLKELDIDRLKYRKGEYEGFIKKVNYTLTMEGVKDVEVEMMYL